MHFKNLYDILHPLGGSFCPFYLFKSSLDSNENVGIVSTYSPTLLWPMQIYIPQLANCKTQRIFALFSFPISNLLLI